MKSVFQLIASVACVFALTACGSAANETKEVVIDPATQVKELVATDLTVGTGTTIAAGDSFTVRYTGWLYNSAATDGKGKQFETSPADAALSFKLGIGQVIPGWDQGIVGMKAGGTRRLTIPASLAYGPAVKYDSKGAVLIPAYSGLVFEVTLVTVTKP
jgi:FKBP-type peptidyl-prolyl cis-trans isomerase FkpA